MSSTSSVAQLPSQKYDTLYPSKSCGNPLHVVFFFVVLHGPPQSSLGAANFELKSLFFKLFLNSEFLLNPSGKFGKMNE